VVRVPHGDCDNAIGAATAQISGETDQVYRDLSCVRPRSRRDAAGSDNVENDVA
jgi:hypothetical protein